MSGVDRITIHHEGAGAPTDHVERFGPMGYTIGIGVSRYEVFRSVGSSFATRHFNHVSLDICLSGNRQDYEVTQADLDLLTNAVAEAAAKGWVSRNATVHPHNETSRTACPGSHVLGRWTAIVHAVWAGLSKPAPAQPTARQHPTLRQGSRGEAVRELQWKLDAACGQGVQVDGIYGARTATGVRNVQRFYHLVPDGVCGPKTWGVIDYTAAIKGVR